MADFAEFFNLLTAAHSVRALTGAGVSTLSGIPDFRSANGVYSKPYQGRSVEEILSLDCFIEHPELFYSWAQDFVYCCEKYEPSIIHRVLAQLEAQGLLKSLYTQNIDLLHSKAGSREVIELHGSAAMHRCIGCCKKFPYAEIAPQVLRGEVPRCPECRALIKPNIIFYGEQLNMADLARAEREMAKTDLLIVLGTSLCVYPVAALPEIVLQHGGKLVIVNAQKTQYDRYATWRCDDLAAFGTAVEKFLAARAE